MTQARRLALLAAMAMAEAARCPIGYYDANTCIAFLSGPGASLDPLAGCVDCGNASLVGDIPKGMYCTGGTKQLACPAGSYCPTAATIEKCTNQHYCPKGSTKPVECVLASSCGGKGLEKPNHMLFVGILLVVEVALFLIMAIVTKRMRVAAKKRARKQHAKGDSTLENQKKMENELRLMVKYGQRWRLKTIGRGELGRELRKVSVRHGSSTGRVLKGATSAAAEAAAAAEDMTRSHMSLTEHMLLNQMVDAALKRSEIVSLSQPINAFSKLAVSFEIKFEQLELKLRNGTSILQKMDGTIQAGEVTALMGPSGAGKTSLLNVLRGEAAGYGSVHGTLSVNGMRIHDLSALKRGMGFVPQLDVMYEDLSVEDNVMFSCLLFNSRVQTREQAQPIVDEMIDVLGLTHIRTSLVGGAVIRGISGGQRKRVSIAMELSLQPLLLFLDEPTSGLDSTTSVSLCQALRRIAFAGVTVVATIHQPRAEIFEAIQNLCLLARGGKLMYCGEIPRVEDYFKRCHYTCPSRTNVADYMMDVVSGEVNNDKGIKPPREKVEDTLQEIWREQHHYKPQPKKKHAAEKDTIRLLESQLPTPGAGEGVRTTVTVARRALLRVWQDKHAILADWLQVYVVGMIIALLFGELEPDSADFLSQMSALTLTIGLIGSSMGLRVFGLTKDIYKREESSGLRQWSFVLGEVLGSLPQIVMVPISFLFGYYFILSPLGSFSAYLVVLLLTQWAVTGVGALIGLLFNPSAASTVNTAVNVVFWACNGVSPQQYRDLVDTLSFIGEVINQLSYSKYLAYAIVGLESFHWQEAFAGWKAGMFYAFGLDDTNPADIKPPKSVSLDWKDESRDIFSNACGALFLHGLITRLLCFFWLHRRPMVAALKHYWFVLKHRNAAPQAEDDDEVIAHEEGEAPVQELVTATKRMLSPQRSKSSAQLLFGDDEYEEATHGHGDAPAAEEKDIAVTFVDSASSMPLTVAKGDTDAKPSMMCCGV